MRPFNIAGSWKIHEPAWREKHTHTHGAWGRWCDPAVGSTKFFWTLWSPTEPGPRPPAAAHHLSRCGGSPWWQAAVQPAASPHSPFDPNELSKVTDSLKLTSTRVKALCTERLAAIAAAAQREQWGGGWGVETWRHHISKHHKNKWALWFLVVGEHKMVKVAGSVLDTEVSAALSDRKHLPGFSVLRRLYWFCKCN